VRFLITFFEMLELSSDLVHGAHTTVSQHRRNILVVMLLLMGLKVKVPILVIERRVPELIADSRQSVLMGLAHHNSDHRTVSGTTDVLRIAAVSRTQWSRPTEVKRKVKGAYSSLQAGLQSPLRGNSHAIWDHTVLPATLQR